MTHVQIVFNNFVLSGNMEYNMAVMWNTIFFVNDDASEFTLLCF